MLVTTKVMLETALAQKYAVAAINTQGGTYDIIRAVCLAAEELKAPVILAHYLATGEYSGHDWFFATARWMAEHVNVPVAIHMDHGDTVENCMNMADLGFTSIMYDGSALSVEENASNTNRVVEYCHARGIPVEAEIGEIGHAGGAGQDTDSPRIASMETVRRYLNICSPDSLAIGIGNTHGFYKSKPNIYLDMLLYAREFTDIPFVLHGCTGMDDNTVRKAIGYGVAKINFGTQIRYKYMEYIRKGCDMDFQGHAWKLSRFAERNLREDVKKIIFLSGSEGCA
ncbi:MAG: class II fructose-bisphosphate aldolase [Synergistaceae bacterium]|jgi:ketose-bisphosphate aldolase|nr:class II fructose-bisphosphate aldolase [Synergistaceae bacterium]